MADVVFDTLGLARRLRERAGFTPEHAEEAAQAIADTIAGPVVTKPDLAELRSAMKSDFAEARSAIQVDLAEFRSKVQSDLVEMRSAMQSDLADTRAEMQADFVALRSATQMDVAQLRSSTKADMAELKSDLTRLILTVATGQLALLLAAMFSLARLSR